MNGVNLRHRLAKLRFDHFLGGVSACHRNGKPVPPPQYVLWDCTRRCNLACVHCGAAGKRYANELDTAQVMALVGELAALRVRMFAVTGGEPLLRADLLDILSQAGRAGMLTGIATNGFLIDDAKARQIGAAGVYSVQISLDGLAATHNSIRRHPQSYVRAVAAASRLIVAGVPLVSAATTVTPRNIHDLEPLRLLVRDIGFSQWRLSVVMPIGRAEDGDLSLDGDGLRELFAFVRRHDSRELPIQIGGNLPFLGRWERRVRRQPMLCPVGFTACCVGVDGHVRGCPEQADDADNSEGSILEKAFGEIWQHGFGRYRSRSLRRVDADCAACRHWNDCYGGCWVMRQGGRQCIKTLLTEKRTKSAAAQDRKHLEGSEQG